VDTREEWDRIFSGLNEETAGKDPWLERWRHVLEASRGSPVLDLGCGAVQDVRFLTELGFAVIAADFSEEALIIHARPPRKRRTWTSPAACCPSPTPISE
jgi:SAM-dependent methyltransferase